jgi:hypothetical protein
LAVGGAGLVLGRPFLLKWLEFGPGDVAEKDILKVRVQVSLGMILTDPESARLDPERPQLFGEPNFRGLLTVEGSGPGTAAER